MIVAEVEAKRGASGAVPDAATCARAVEARDARFDGVFFVAIVTTRIYCRPICPSRRARPEHRRFFASAAGAERAGFRPCLRCRPELAPGVSAVDAVSRIAGAAAARIAAGALNGGSVAGLAQELGVGERHLRRVMEASLGVSPLELAQTHRLLLARKLLRETPLSITRIAYASGFESLRRFNAAFRERYRCAPSALRPRDSGKRTSSLEPAHDGIRLRLAYRSPFAWESLLGALASRAVGGVVCVESGRYTRSVQLNGCRGIVRIADAAGSVLVDVSHALLPVLMSLLSRVRALLDLDADPRVIDAHLARGPLRELVAECPGLRVPGPFSDFEGILHALLGGIPSDRRTLDGIAREFGRPVQTDHPRIVRLMPEPRDVRTAGAIGLQACGLDAARSRALVAIVQGLRDDPSISAPLWRWIGTTLRREGLDEAMIHAVLQVGQPWSDVIPTDPDVEHRVHPRSEHPALFDLDRYRPWRSYAAAHVRRAALTRAL